MTFSAIRSIATSALTSTQVRMQVTSSNIANADVDGYTKKTATQAATTSSGAGTGTLVTAIKSDVDKFLLRDLISAASELGAAEAANGKLDTLQSQLGSTTSSDDSGTSISDTISTLLTSLTSLSGTVESDTLQGLVVESLDAVATQLRETSATVQDLRAQADEGIADAVDAANEALETISDLNEQIVSAKALGQTTADLEDKRNTALQTLATQLDVSYIVRSNGEMRVSTTSGTTLVDGSVHKLSYAPAAVVGADTVFSGVTVDGKDISSEISSGTIGGLIEQRDTVLVAVQDSLDTLATALIDSLNAAYNAGSSVPAPSTLTGAVAVTGSDALDATGTLRLAITDSDGALVSYSDLELDDLDTVDELVDAINAISGLSASVASGKLVITSSDGYGVAVADIDSTLGSSDQGFSDYFGLNDLLTGTGAATIKVRSDILSGTSSFSTAVLSTDEDLATGDIVLSASSAFAQSLESVLSDDQAFEASGGLRAQTTSFAEYGAAIVAKVATTASSASSALETRQSDYDTSSDALSSVTGVNVDEETAALNELEQQYSTAAQLLSILNDMFDALLAAVKS